MSEHDTLQRFIFEHAEIRGEIAHLGPSFQRIMQQHDYPKAIHQLLAEMLLSTVLMASMIKFEGQLTAQLVTPGAVKVLVAKCDHNYNVRAYAKFDQTQITPAAPTPSLNDGKLVITIEHANQKPYQSMVKIRDNSIQRSLEHYFSQSEQISTKLWLAVDDHRAAGMLLQLLPQPSCSQREQFWEYATVLGETLTPSELLTLDNKTLLHRLYHEQDVRLFEPSTVQFKCSCSVDKMGQALRMLGIEEAKRLLNEQPRIEVRCEYCNHHYQFDSIDVETLFKLH